MSKSIFQFQPVSGWTSTVLLTVVAITFGIFAQSHASEPAHGFIEVTDRFSAEAVSLVSACPTKVDASKHLHNFLYR